MIILCNIQFVAHLLKCHGSGIFAANPAPCSVYVRVCERENGEWRAFHGVHLNLSKATVVTADLLVACVTNERENFER
jgi:hypothetical protein